MMVWCFLLASRRRKGETLQLEIGLSEQTCERWTNSGMLHLGPSISGTSQPRSFQLIVFILFATRGVTSAVRREISLECFLLLVTLLISVSNCRSQQVHHKSEVALNFQTPIKQIIKFVDAINGKLDFARQLSLQLFKSLTGL